MWEVTDICCGGSLGGGGGCGEGEFCEFRRGVGGEAAGCGGAKGAWGALCVYY